MGTLSMIASGSLRCKGCGQVSRVAAGSWEAIGRLPNDDAAFRCTKCGAGVALGLFSSRLMPRDVVDQLIEMKRRDLSQP